MGQGTGVAGVQEGDILAGKYRIDCILGVGGMGAVVAAHHVQLDDKVAIKFLLPDMLDNPEAVERFAREARAAVKIKNEHVARVTDVGTLENGAPYMVMEYLDGSDLSAMVRTQGPLPLAQAVEFLLQACEAIAEAHGLGIVHRDLKPANLFCVRRRDGQQSIKVLDFGISKVTGPAGSVREMSMTRTSAVMGSPLYMSPEQMQSSRDVDLRTDIWALGVILFELLTGEVPFNGATMPEVCVTIATKAPPPLRSLLPQAPAAVEQVILRCLEKDSERRFSNVAELAYALVAFGPPRARASVERIAGFLQGAAMSAPGSAASPRDSREGPSATMTAATWGNTARTPPRSGRGVMIVTALLLVAGAAGAAFFWRNSNLPREGAAVSAELPVAPPSAPVAAAAAAVPTPPPLETTPPIPVEKAPPPPEVAPTTTRAASPEVAKPAAGLAARPVRPAPGVVKHSEPPAPAPTAHVAPPAQGADLGGRL